MVSAALGSSTPFIASTTCREASDVLASRQTFENAATTAASGLARLSSRAAAMGAQKLATRAAAMRAWCFIRATDRRRGAILMVASHSDSPLQAAVLSGIQTTAFEPSGPWDESNQSRPLRVDSGYKR